MIPLIRRLHTESAEGGAVIPVPTNGIQEVREGLLPYTLRWGTSTHRKPRGDEVPTAYALAKRASGVIPA